MTPSPKDTQPALNGQAARATFRDFVQEQGRQAIRATFIDILEEEVSQFIGAARYARTPTRVDRRAGHRTRTIGTTAGVIDDLPVPRTRGGFHTQLFERYRRRMPEVDELMREMFVGGVSQQQVGSVVEQLTGAGSSPSTVSRYLTCYRVLAGAADPRADSVLQMAHTELLSWASGIANPTERQRFLNEVASHRAILTGVEQRGPRLTALL
ncbi:MAG TPA: transposase [Chloroflexaceae bacterium]|nr:transposase [Chloroflexaceae bacterium]